MYDIVIAGAGGCGREVFEMAQEVFPADQYRIKGFLSDVGDELDDFPELKERFPVIGKIIDYEVQPQDRFLLAIGSPEGRKLVAERLLARGAEFLTLVHPTACVFPSASLGSGVIVYPFATVSAYVQVQDFCLLNAYAACGHDAVIGKFSVLCPQSLVLGNAVLGEECFIATHATVAPKKQMGNRVVVSANSSALRDAEDDAFILGVPGKEM